MNYEILVRTGLHEGLGWDKITHAFRETIQGAKDYKAAEQDRNPKAEITIRDADTLKTVK